jgi:hypothetical protein
VKNVSSAFVDASEVNKALFDDGHYFISQETRSFAD